MLRYSFLDTLKKICRDQGRLAGSVGRTERATPDLRVVGSGPTSGGEST